MDTESRRQADVYVFALLAHKEVETLDPLNVGQWRFFVLATSRLDERTRSQHSITLATLKALTDELKFGEVAAAVLAAAELT
jgi:hypothetical protein